MCFWPGVAEFPAARVVGRDPGVGVPAASHVAVPRHAARAAACRCWLAHSTTFQSKLGCRYAILHTYIPLTLYPRRGSRSISDIPPRYLRFK
jgi:hypothetical protein